MLRATLSLAAVLICTSPALAAPCLNKFLARTDSPKQIVTLLTGKLTFEEAQALAAAIKEGSAPPPEWLDERGRTIARLLGDLQVVRPMPVGCDGKPSGVVMVATFLATRKPERVMYVKLTPDETVEFTEQ